MAKTNFFEIIPQGTKFDFMRAGKIFIPLSALLVAASLVIIFTKGFNWGIDFAGGLEMRVEFKGAAQNVRIGDMRKTMENLPPDLPLQGVQVTNFVMPGRNVFSIKAKGEENVTRAGGDAALQDLASKVLTFLETKYGKGDVVVVSTDMVGPRVGSSLRKQGLYAIIYAMIGILVYVGFRFNFKYSPGGVIALVHDVIITAGIFSLFSREMNLVIVAALLTIAGYSINDTIVIFDRIREGRAGRYRAIPLHQAVNNSINETLSRTVLTSGVTMLVVIALLFLGGEILFDFALAMTIGIVIGTYSSIFIASPIFVMLEDIFAARRKAKGAAR
ncbi:MAG: protein translocase subunit SecF [Myxococcales bacterium]|nr:protein translocase subunit SecF [Myxococcales bacterium]